MDDLYADNLSVAPTDYGSDCESEKIIVFLAPLCQLEDEQSVVLWLVQ
jgi:hypothetical protein